jgi:hypothetical protein
MLKKFWPSLLFLAILILYIAWINYQINAIYRNPVGAVVEPLRGERAEPNAIDLGETNIAGGRP